MEEVRAYGLEIAWLGNHLFSTLIKRVIEHPSAHPPSPNALKSKPPGDLFLLKESRADAAQLTSIIKRKKAVVKAL